MENKSCFNCKFYLQYYVKRLTELVPLNKGHCRNSLLTVREKRDFPYEIGCRFWQSGEKTEEGRTEEIKEVIRKMQKRLDDIVLLLQNK